MPANAPSGALGTSFLDCFLQTPANSSPLAGEHACLCLSMLGDASEPPFPLVFSWSEKQLHSRGRDFTGDARLGQQQRRA